MHLFQFGRFDWRLINSATRPFSANFTAPNLFDSGNAEYATASQGAVSTPFTTNVNDGTWVEFDFGTTITLDRFVMAARQNNVDLIGTSRLIISSDPIFDSNDFIFSFNPSGANGAGIIRNLGSVSGRYARWEALTRTGSGLNLGAKQMWFLNTPSGQHLLPPPTAINSSPPFNGNFIASQAVNGDAGYSSTSEYASLGVGANMFIDFDFGASVAVSGFDFWNRVVDHVTSFNLLFADSPDFGSVVATLPFTASDNGNQVNSATFSPVTARYIRFQATGAAGGNNTGVREIQFYTPAGQPPFMTQPPQGGTRLAGDSITFTIVAGGDAPLSYQWWKQTSPLSGATNSTLTLTNLQIGDSGDYRVAISNVFGAITSTPATLTVIDPAVDTTSNRQVWFQLDETFFLAATDSSGNGHDGILQGFVDDDSQWVAGRIAGGLRFETAGSGSNEVVLVSDAGGQLDFSSNPEFTLSAWVRATAGQEDGAAILAKGTGGGGEQYAVDVLGGAYRFFVRGALGGALVLQSPVRPNGAWQHVVAVYSRELSRMKLYVDTTEAGSATPLSGALLSNTHDVSIGSRQSTSNDYNLNLNGVLDDVRIYSRALTPADVSALYHEAAPLAPSIAGQPQPVITAAGSPASFSVAADGTVPLTYQWRKLGVAIANATNVTFTITNAQASDEGAYSVAITNAYGNATSTEAQLTVVSFLDLRNAPAQASSIFNPTFPPAGAFDGLRQSTGPNTARWASAAIGPPHWIYVDLGQDADLRRIWVDWENAYGSSFTIRVRTDAEGPSTNPDDWHSVASVSGYAQSVQGVDGADVMCDFQQSQIVMPGNIAPSATTSIGGHVLARYVMVHVTAIGGTFLHTSIWELQVEAIAPAHIQTPVINGDSLTLSFSGTPGHNYEIQRANRITGPWATVTNLPPGAAYTDPGPRAPVELYRVLFP